MLVLLETPYEMAYDAARRFRALRRRKKVSMKALSAQSGVAYSTLRRFESSGEISFLSLVKLASALGEDEQIRALFRNIQPQSIEEVIRGNRR